MMTKKQFTTTFAWELETYAKFHEAYDVTFEVRYVLDAYDEAEGNCGYYVEVITYLDDMQREDRTVDVADAKAKTFYASKEIAEWFGKMTKAEVVWSKAVYR